MKKVAIQGGEGSYSHIAAQHIFKKDFELIKNDNFKVCFEQCSNKEVDFAVIPFENSTHGSVNENYDLLSSYKLHIIKELYLKINFHLIGTPESQLKDIRKVYSHRVSMSQIKNFLEENTQIEPHVFADNGRAVEFIKEDNNKENAAAASKLASEIYGMKILKENIHDNPKNYTRFFVISNKKDRDLESNKTSIQFEVKHEPGTLVKALSCFSERGIDLMKIESRPILNTNWEYLFYADLLMDSKASLMEEALEDIKNVTVNLRVLGTYGKGEYIDT